jgi:two-component system, LytTR family, sensor kinase
MSEVSERSAECVFLCLDPAMSNAGTVSRDPQQLSGSTAVAVAACLFFALSQATNVYAMRRSTSRSSWIVALVLTLPPWLLMATTSPWMVRLTKRFPFGPRDWGRSVLVHGLASLAFSLTHLSAISLTYMLQDTRPFVWASFTRAFGVSFRYLMYQDILAYWAILGIYLALHYSNLQRRLIEARLVALRAQLNPHFLFNTLNAVSALALRRDHAGVTEMLGRLSDLLHATLDGQVQEVPLSKEIGLVDDYIAIQHVRFADRLTVEKRVSPEALNGLVPPMILQPIIENAIEHGVNARQEPGVVNITAMRQNGSLVIEVSDSGPGFPASGRQEGIGLRNTRARLDELYGPRHQFECGSSSQGGASVRIMIPYHHAPPDV